MRVLVPALECVFFAGMTGSLVLVVISGIEDIRTMMEKD
jgi:hypothetical protein